MSTTIERHRPHGQIASGHVDRRPGRQLRRVAIGFDDRMFAKIKALSEANNDPFGRTVRALIAIGLRS
jgi:hypothetical protein